jgi:peptide/nickel transport system substrate-binding protein
MAQTVTMLGRTVLGAYLLAGMALLPGPGQAAARASGAKASVPPLTLAYDQSYSTIAGAWTYRFNPFAGGTFVDGAIFENLYIVSIYDNAKQYPMLATYYRWSADLKTLTFTIRQGVKWSDGRPLTPDDVLFSIMLGKTCAVCDTADLWGPKGSLASATKRGNTVSLTFKRVDTSIFAPLVNHLWIVPRHIWAYQRAPDTWTNPNPVGTGPFTQVENASSRSFDLAKNPNYWQHGEPRMPAIRAVLYTDGALETRDLEAGKIDWGTFFLENVTNVFDRLNPNFHHYYSTRTTPVELYFNQTRYPYSLPAFRQAMSMAIDRNALTGNAEYGYTVPSSGTGLEGQFPTWVDHSLDAQSRALSTYNPAAARALLRKAGFRYDSAGNLLDPRGHMVSLDINTVNGWTDWDTACTIMAQNLADIGIDAGTQQLQYNTFVQKASLGDFDATIFWSVVGDSPYSALYNPIMSSQSYFPIGTNSYFLLGTGVGVASGANLGRYGNPAAEALLAQFRTTTDAATQHRAIDGLQALWLKELPAIPLFPFPIWEAYNTTRYSGFPTAAEYYASGRPEDSPDFELVLLRVHDT